MSDIELMLFSGRGLYQHVVIFCGWLFHMHFVFHERKE